MLILHIPQTFLYRPHMNISWFLHPPDIIAEKRKQERTFLFDVPICLSLLMLYSLKMAAGKDRSPYEPASMHGFVRYRAFYTKQNLKNTIYQNVNL